MRYEYSSTSTSYKENESAKRDVNRVQSTNKHQVVCVTTAKKWRGGELARPRRAHDSNVTCARDGDGEGDGDSDGDGDGDHQRGNTESNSGH